MIPAATLVALTGFCWCVRKRLLKAVARIARSSASGPAYFILKLHCAPQLGLSIGRGRLAYFANNAVASSRFRKERWPSRQVGLCQLRWRTENQSAPHPFDAGRG